MMRVYAIFQDPFKISYRKKYFSNPFLFIYIVLILLPNILILTVWLAVDPFKSNIFQFSTKSHVLAFEKCDSSYTIVWVCLLLLYIFIVMIALTILAFKSSNIRYKNFKDTKATNIFTFLTISIVITTMIYWYFLSTFELSSSNDRHNKITLFCGHFSVPLLCQMLLFVPKVYAPLRRWLSKLK